MDIGLKQIPKIKISVEDILRKAESKRDLVTYGSEISGVGYIADMSEVLIVTRDRGYLLLPVDNAEEIIQELKYVSEEAERRRRD